MPLPLIGTGMLLCIPTEEQLIMEVKLRIRRFNPELDKKPRWETYSLTGVEKTHTVLELLNRVKWEQDGTLTLRRSCAHGVCGSDAMRINGVNRLACKILMHMLEVKDGDTIQIEPILGLPIVKDMVVDFEPFFEDY